MRTKIVLIGAGSAMFTQGIVSDMIKRSHHRKWHLSLVDVSQDILTSVSRLVQKMIDTRGADIEISSSTDRRDVLPGADFVITSIGVGGRRAWEKDVYIPRKYGIFQPVGDSVAVGGISRSMRMIPAMVAIAKDVKELCPDAVFFNVSNPMTTICRAIAKAVDIPVYGLCAGTYNVERYLAEFIGTPKEDVTALAVGLNHFTWIYDLKVKGQDAWPLVREKIKELAAQRRVSQPIAAAECDRI
ncbi:MAG: melA [Paenibacillaceae bacterium]|jgi:alpha-galactosidase|nr:melA [Paenibacillaceae bacterium]